MTISPKTLLIAALIHIYSVLVIANNWALLTLSDKEQFILIEFNQAFDLTSVEFYKTHVSHPNKIK